MAIRRCVLLLMVAASLLFGACTNNTPGYKLNLASHEQPTPTPLPPIRFPQDEAPHNDLTEWWYYTGHLGSGNRRYGFELVTFQVIRGDQPKVYLAHFAITDLNRDSFSYAQRGTTDSQPQPEHGFSLNVGGWKMSGLSGQDHLQAAMKNYAIDLTLDSTKPPVLEANNGIENFGPYGFSYYYSRTRMEVRGTINDHGTKLPLTGEAWMDHQWGNFLSLLGTGWDWYSIQLNDDTEIMLYQVRAQGGKRISLGTWVNPDGTTSTLESGQFTATATGHWTSPKTGITYPSGWQVNIPSKKLRLDIQPALKDQELVTERTTSQTYWEGAVSIQGTRNGRPIRGKGYVELTGYGTASR